MRRFICVAVKIILAGLSFSVTAQYNPEYVASTTAKISNQILYIQKISQKNNYVKIKYFAERDLSGTIYNRYQNWNTGKAIIAISSGGYTSSCYANNAHPVGICIENGRVINQGLKDEMDGLIIINDNGRMFTYNLKKNDLKIRLKDSSIKKLDIRGNSYNRAEFIKLAKESNMTVFQSHLLAYDNKMIISDSSAKLYAQRRFLAMCTKDNEIIHFIINIPEACTLLEGTRISLNYLANFEKTEVMSIINLESGCTNIYEVYDKDGNQIKSAGFTGIFPASSAVNLLVYYFEENPKS